MTTIKQRSDAFLTGRAEEARLVSLEEAQLPLTKTPELFFTGMPQLSTEDARILSSPSLFSTASPLPSFWSAVPTQNAVLLLLLTFYSDFYAFPRFPSLPMFILFGGAK
jgi:hypothetical protein